MLGIFEPKEHPYICSIIWTQLNNIFNSPETRGNLLGAEYSETDSYSLPLEKKIIILDALDKWISTIPARNRRKIYKEWLDSVKKNYIEKDKQDKAAWEAVSRIDKEAVARVEAQKVVEEAKRKAYWEAGYATLSQPSFFNEQPKDG